MGIRRMTDDIQIAEGLLTIYGHIRWMKSRQRYTEAMRKRRAENAYRDEERRRARERQREQARLAKAYMALVEELDQSPPPYIPPHVFRDYS